MIKYNIIIRSPYECRVGNRNVKFVSPGESGATQITPTVEQGRGGGEAIGSSSLIIGNITNGYHKDR
jgi:hypothetical protein